LSVSFEYGMGCIFFDPVFNFPNGGEPKPKLLVLLNEPTEEEEPYIFVWTTSEWPRTIVGCYPELQCFFIPAAADCFPKDTHICLHDFLGATYLEYDITNYRDRLS